MTYYEFVVEGKPAVKQRPRMTRRGRAYTPAATHEAERHIAEQYKGPFFTEPVCIEVRYGKDYQSIIIEEITEWKAIRALRGDIDNYLKLTMDALNGVAWEDDSIVKSVFIYFDEEQ